MSTIHISAAPVVAIAWVMIALGCAEGSALEDSAASGDPGPSGSGGSPGGGGGGASPSGGPSSTSAAGPSGSTSTSSSTGGDGGAGEGGRAEGGAAATTTSSVSSTASSSSTGGGFVEQLCAPGEYATGLSPGGALTCAPFAGHAQTAIAGGCSIYFGHRDSCTGCTTAPAKWGWARSALCSNGLGVNNTCVATSLGGTTVQLFGLNTSGDVDGNDKFYTSFHCAVGDVATQPGPCPSGTFASAIESGTVTCTPASGLALGRVRSSCHLYFGWRDSCDGCTTAPSKWGRVNDAACTNGLGTNNTCTQATLAGESVRLFGLNTGGEVDGNDKFHIGLRCDDAPEQTSTAAGTCPAGTLVSGIFADGTVRCTSPAPDATAVFRDRCSAYFGWRDSCSGCTTTPSKWGKAWDGGCQNGVGVDNTCAVASLGGQSVRLFGLNTDGNVNDDDKFHVGFKCE